MATPNEKLAASLKKLQELQKDGRRVFRSDELTKTHKDRLLAQGFIQSVMKGWLILSNPDSPGTDTEDSTSWYASFWQFCVAYCDSRFGDEWHLSPEESLSLFAENTVIPTQIIIYAPKGTNNTVKLPFETSLYDLKQKQMPPKADVKIRDGLRLYSPAAALIRVPDGFFAGRPVEARVALAGIKDASEVLGYLLEGGHSVVAGRLVGAFRHIDRVDIADEILSTMKTAGYDVRPNDPFDAELVFGALPRAASPISGRIITMWSALRETVLEVFPEAPGLPKDRKGYLKFIDDIYQSDAYHSLSIEGYHVTPELIERVQAGSWHPEDNEEDRKSRDALAARGYWQAFQKVKETVAQIITGENAGALVDNTHRDWYRELFGPCVTAGLIPAAALAGYRNDAVYLRGSHHVPPRHEAVRDAMPTLFECLESETEPSVRAVLGHWMFGYIHPYPDGNGRMARFLMNAMLASGGYPWTVIRVEDRDKYMAALEQASINQDIIPFAEFIAERVAWSMEQDAS